MENVHVTHQNGPERGVFQGKWMLRRVPVFIQLLCPVSPVRPHPFPEIPFELPADRIFTRLARYLELWLAGEVNWIRLSRAVRRAGSSYRLLAEVLSRLICFRQGVICRAHSYAPWPSIGREVGLLKTNRPIRVCLLAGATSVEC
jgi:hypothetical protein